MAFGSLDDEKMGQTAKHEFTFYVSGCRVAGRRHQNGAHAQMALTSWLDGNFLSLVCLRRFGQWRHTSFGHIAAVACTVIFAGTCGGRNPLTPLRWVPCEDVVEGHHSTRRAIGPGHVGPSLFPSNGFRDFSPMVQQQWLQCCKEECKTEAGSYREMHPLKAKS